MHQVAPLAAPRESVFAVLASSARRMSLRELSSIAAASGPASPKPAVPTPAAPGQPISLLPVNFAVPAS